MTMDTSRFCHLVVMGISWRPVPSFARMLVAKSKPN